MTNPVSRSSSAMRSLPASAAFFPVPMPAPPQDRFAYDSLPQSAQNVLEEYLYEDKKGGRSSREVWDTYTHEQKCKRLGELMDVFKSGVEEGIDHIYYSPFTSPEDPYLNSGSYSSSELLSKYRVTELADEYPVSESYIKYKASELASNYNIEIKSEMDSYEALAQLYDNMGCGPKRPMSVSDILSRTYQLKLSLIQRRIEKIKSVDGLSSSNASPAARVRQTAPLFSGAQINAPKSTVNDLYLRQLQAAEERQLRDQMTHKALKPFPVAEVKQDAVELGVAVAAIGVGVAVAVTAPVSVPVAVATTGIATGTGTTLALVGGTAAIPAATTTVAVPAVTTAVTAGAWLKAASVVGATILTGLAASSDANAAPYALHQGTLKLLPDGEGNLTYTLKDGTVLVLQKDRAIDLRVADRASGAAGAPGSHQVYKIKGTIDPFTRAEKEAVLLEDPAFANHDFRAAGDKSYAVYELKSEKQTQALPEAVLDVVARP